MLNKRYDWAFEVAGPAASYARPDSGSSPISSPLPPPLGDHRNDDLRGLQPGGIFLARAHRTVHPSSVPQVYAKL